MVDKPIAEMAKHGLRPLSDPLGDNHHTDAEFTQEDREIGELSWWLGGLFIDKEGVCPDKPFKETYWHNEMTSLDQWTRVARALRIHGLKIVNQEKSEADVISGLLREAERK